MSINLSASLSLSLTDTSFGTSALTKSISAAFAGTVSSYIQQENIGCAAPSGLSGTPSTSGGSLAAATYYYKVTALNGTGETTGSGETSVTTTGSTSTVSLTWTAPAGATSFKVYRGTAPNTETVYFASTATTFTDTGGAGTSGTVPGSNSTGTTWTPTLQQTPLNGFYFRNLSGVNSVSLAWTPTGGSTGTVQVLEPQGVIFFINQVAGGGITALTATASAAGTPVEASWIS